MLFRQPSTESFPYRHLSTGLALAWLLSSGIALASDLPPQQEAAADQELAIFLLTLPSWTAESQTVQVIRPKQDTLSRLELEPHAITPVATEEVEAKKSPTSEAIEQAKPELAPPSAAPAISLTTVATDDSPTSAHLLIPQLAPPTPKSIKFPQWTPASDIWIKGFAAVVEGERHEADGNLVSAIASFQTARASYELVEQRFPEWQTEIIHFRLGDLERRIRLLVQKTSTASANKPAQD